MQFEVIFYGPEVNEFELQSRYYVHFRTNILWKDINPVILSTT